jgi:hypothetical protein
VSEALLGEPTLGPHDLAEVRPAYGFHAAVKDGPTAPELAADAHDCIMVRSSKDRPNTRPWRDSAPLITGSPRISSAATDRVSRNVTARLHGFGKCEPAMQKCLALSGARDELPGRENRAAGDRTIELEKKWLTK